ncbi:MAG: amidohydrolase [Verrucomicrobiales bacterium]|nr:amidohydrolase [Verrucomicrobiales bacterium]
MKYFFLVAFAHLSVVAATPTDEINRLAESLRPQLVTQRRDIHIHPELANRELRTARIVADKLRALGFDEVRTNVAHTGIVALIKGGKPGPVVAVRADLDALPINETIDVPYKSQTPGVKHACGHDVHTTIELGVAEVLSKMRAQLPGSVKFIFEPAEEGPPEGEEGGSRLLIKEGALENPRPLAIFGLHTTAEIQTGKIGVRAGGAQAAADTFEIIIHGKRAHPAFPNDGVDAVVVAAQCVNALHTIKSRRTAAFDPMILTIGTIKGGHLAEEVAASVTMTGTLRTFSESTRKDIKQMMRELLQGVCDGNKATFDLKITEETMVVYNDPKLVEETLPSLRRALGETNVIQAELRMGAEDFSFFQQVIPGVLFRLGSGNKAKGIVANQHTAEFDVDEECLVVGTKAMANTVFDFLERQPK